MDTQITSLYDTYLKYPKISTDSRMITPGSIFFGLKGPSFDGNAYAKDAIQKGAAIAVIDNEKYKEGENYILVKDALICLQALAKYHRQKLGIPIIGITGSNGKTTTKELISQVLRKKYNILATKGNLNNLIGVPLTLLSLNIKHEIGIIEMGSNGKGEIEKLCEISLPDYGLITSIGKAHLEGFGNINGVVQEKTALYRSIAKKGKTIFFNKDADHLEENLPSNTENIEYTNTKGFLFNYESKSTFPKIVGACIRGQHSYDLESKMYGSYNVCNIIAALTVGCYFDINLKVAVEALNNYIPKNNRSEIQQYKGASVYLDAYNANPTSVSLVVKEYTKLQGLKVLVLGDMLEVGDNELNEHKIILQQINESQFESVFLFGELYKKFEDEFPNFKFYSVFERLKIDFNRIDLKGKNVLLKGSRGMGLERLLD